MSTHTRIEPGRIVDGQPLGLFYHNQVNFQGPHRIETQTWLFLPDNRISRVYPYGGTGLFDPAHCSNDTCGRYEIGGAQLAVHWDGGRTDRWALAAAAEGISLDGTLYRPARAMTAASLAGQWSDTSSNVYAFDGADRFSFGGNGTYRVQDFALTLDFADGTVRQRTLFAASAREPAEMISVEGEVYSRR